MADIWNKYANTAARKHGKPGRDARPKSLTIDTHGHIAVPRAAEFIKPHLDVIDRSLLRISPRRNQGAQRQAGSRHPRRA